MSHRRVSIDAMDSCTASDGDLRERLAHASNILQACVPRHRRGVTAAHFRAMPVRENESIAPHRLYSKQALSGSASCTRAVAPHAENIP